MLEWNVIESCDQVMQVSSTLQSTPSGKQLYQQLCDRQFDLKELVSFPLNIFLSRINK